ncbi:ArnT family glycosyltransferase [Umezawaea endophytica]|uniref:Glycosyltransferase family 39 protein n=1 Tax=Umezawaea endophytica TaxID=1654476 RepID=A0A9X2VR19_9PSEU|nr:glycosyltransferase family 39 protein [Umezawaea endophytica]MCS7481326.1 glycosyltransferase family 39 protein [Umezawaea endophytica]
MTTTLAPSATTVAPAVPEPRRDPRWVRPAFLALLAASAVLFLWNLSASGFGNGFYAAATQSATQSWKAWLFGSLDSGNVLTVDKPPAFLWVSGLFARIFGFSSWTVLAPQALEGVAAVGLLYATVKRTSGPVAGLFAGAALALTPVATLMFRFNLPDALLVLLMVAAAYCTVRSLEKASPRWIALAGVAIGFAFLTKMGQALLVLPALGLVYLIAAPTGIGKRLLHLLGAAVAMVVSAGWFIVLVELWPADSRPYIGGSTNDSLWELAVGYNGLGRLFGQGGGGGGVMTGGGGNTGFGGASGIGRMFGASFGNEVSWLLPAALIGLVAGLWFTRRAPRTSRTRAALVLWGGWMVVTALVFSFMSGIIHPYYAVALAPGIVGTVAISGRELWRGRAHAPARIALAAMVAATGFWSFALLNRVPEWLPFVRWTIAVVTVVVATVIVLGVTQAKKVVLTGVLVAGLLGTVSYSVATAASSHNGSIPVSGPAGYVSGGMGGGMGGPGEESTGSALTELLKSTDTLWAAATVSSQSAASLELATGKAVIGIGGWSGSDPAPTLAEFQQYVADGKIGYYVPGGRMGGGGGSGEIATWVEANFTAVEVDGTTVYDLSE